jgi:gas vesicle protein
MTKPCSCSQGGSQCGCRKKGACPVGTFVFGLFLGGVYGMLFTKTAGEELRKKLKKSKEPCKDLFLAGAEMDLEFLKYVQEKVAEILKSK